MKAGNFSWYDLMTTDTKAAGAFYRDVIGWEAKDVGVGDRPYQTFSMGAANVGGLMPIPEAACAQGARPCWRGYILVDDVDACMARLTAAGGKVLRGPVEIPGMLRYADVADPHGATFIIFKGMSAAPPVELAPDAPGNIGWRELHAGDAASDFAFYENLFGWRKSQAIEMGPMGVYQTFAGSGEAQGEAIGGMMTRTADTPMPFWMYYFNVDGIDAAAARVVKAGGTIMMGPHQVPTGQWIAQCSDPQGAWFSMLSWKH